MAIKMISSVSTRDKLALFRTLEGILNATKADKQVGGLSKQLLSTLEYGPGGVLDESLQTWVARLVHPPEGLEECPLHVAKLALAVSYMRAQSYSNDHNFEPVLTVFWGILQGALKSSLFERARAGRSHQGFLSIPFCTLLNGNGDNEELWRLHVWLPNCPKVDPEYAIHSHQSFGQSWILAGEAVNTLYSAQPAESSAAATHAIYRLGSHTTLKLGSDQEKQGTVIHNTGQKMTVRATSCETSTRNMSYSVPADTFHTTDIENGTVLATLFFFDANRGYNKAAGIPLGPVDVPEVTQYRNPEGVGIPDIVNTVSIVRAWEMQTNRAYELAAKGEHLSAAHAFRVAAADWRSARERTRKLAEIKDFSGLDRYRDAAEAMSIWVDHSGRAAEALRLGENETAGTERARGRDACAAFAAFRLVKRCLEADIGT